MQPFHVHVAFPTGHDEAKRIALFGPQRFAVLAIDHERVLQALLKRDAAGHAAVVGAFGDHPLGLRLQFHAGQQRGQRHTGPLGTAEETVAILDCGQRGEARLAHVVAGALEEIDSRDRRQSPNLLHREHQRLLHQSMDQQRVLGRIDIWYS